MDKPIIAVIQHKLLITKTLDELLAYYHRFLRIAKTKGSVLAVFPEYSGLAVGIPMLPGWRNALIKEAATPKKGLLPKLKGMLAGSAANVMRVDLKKSLQLTLAQMPESLYDIYVSVFSELAQQYGMTLVAGSLYAYDGEMGALQHAAVVFGPDGALLGRQAQVIPDASTLDLAQPGQTWAPIDSPVGRIGILFGAEALYPEPARVLAYQGADMLLTLAATKRPATYHKIRQAALARCQENQLYGSVSFLIGNDPFDNVDDAPFLGRSAIFAPLEFTPRFSGVMTELGSAQAEGVVTAEWDFPALHNLWETSETPVRKQMPLEQVALLAQVYGRELTLEASAALPTSTPAPNEATEESAPPPATKSLEDETTPTMTTVEEIPLFTPILPTELQIIPLEEPEDADLPDFTSPESSDQPHLPAGSEEEQKETPDDEPLLTESSVQVHADSESKEDPDAKQSETDASSSA